MTTTYKLALYQLWLSRSIAALAAVCALSVFLYGVFLMLAVEHTAARTALQTQVDTIVLHLSTLETEYLQQTRELSPERAAELGFVAPTETAAVFTNSDARSLSLKQ
ncbi:MAG TPA: hypothetical protein VG984_02600 [Candidatus Paceibacterota bacterium]|nr:hypothetical protein [Candidatus Paceibacterota bacterium]